MTEQPNRIGAALGVHGHGLDAIYHRIGLLIDAVEANTAAIADLVAAQGAVNPAWGLPGDTTCNLNALQLLCAIATTLGLETVTTPTEPAFRCGGAFLNEFVYTVGWVQAVNFPLSGGEDTQAYYALWADPPAGLESGIETQVIPEVGDPIGLIRSLNPARATVCISGINDGNISHFYWRRYSQSTLVPLSEGGFGVVDPDEVWTTGATLTVDPSWYYVLFAVVNTPGEAPGPTVRLFYTEGGVG